MAQYLNAALFREKTARLLEAIKKGFLKTWPSLTKNLIKKHIIKSSNRKMLHLHIRKQVLKTTKEKPPDIDLEENSKTKVLFCTAVNPRTKKYGGNILRSMRMLPITSSRVNKYIYVMYKYGYNDILTTAMKNRSDK